MVSVEASLWTPLVPFVPLLDTEVDTAPADDDDDDDDPDAEEADDEEDDGCVAVGPHVMFTACWIPNPLLHPLWLEFEQHVPTHDAVANEVVELS